MKSSLLPYSVFVLLFFIYVFIQFVQFFFGFRVIWSWRYLLSIYHDIFLRGNKIICSYFELHTIMLYTINFSILYWFIKFSDLEFRLTRVFCAGSTQLHFFFFQTRITILNIIKFILWTLYLYYLYNPINSFFFFYYLVLIIYIETGLVQSIFGLEYKWVHRNDIWNSTDPNKQICNY